MRNNEQAVESYMYALQHKPSYTRARSNLAISLMNLQRYEESAACSLGALEINNSEHLWQGLETCFMLLRRKDLLQIAQQRNVNLFRGEFDF